MTQSTFKIIESGQCFRPRVGEDKTYYFIAKDSALAIREGRYPNEFEVCCELDEWNGFWRNYFDLSTNYLKIRNTISSLDKAMSKYTDFGTGIRILRQDPWETLISFIISQQQNIKSIRNKIELISQRWGKKISFRDFDKKREFYAFPSPSELSKANLEDLLECRLGYRAPYILDATSKITSGELKLDDLTYKDDGTLIDDLKSIKGVGNKVARCIALFAYHRLACVPIDTWIHKFICSYGSDPFAKFGKYAGIMQQYIFYYLQNHKDEFSK